MQGTRKRVIPEYADDLGRPFNEKEYLKGILASMEKLEDILDKEKQQDKLYNEVLNRVTGIKPNTRALPGMDVKDGPLPHEDMFYSSFVHVATNGNWFNTREEISFQDAKKRGVDIETIESSVNIPEASEPDAQPKSTDQPVFVAFVRVPLEHYFSTIQDHVGTIAITAGLTIQPELSTTVAKLYIRSNDKECVKKARNELATLAQRCFEIETVRPIGFHAITDVYVDQIQGDSYFGLSMHLKEEFFDCSIKDAIYKIALAVGVTIVVGVNVITIHSRNKKHVLEARNKIIDFVRTNY
jgi:hypothetical protein